MLKVLLMRNAAGEERRGAMKGFGALVEEGGKGHVFGAVGSPKD